MPKIWKVGQVKNFSTLLILANHSDNMDSKNFDISIFMIDL